MIPCELIQELDTHVIEALCMGLCGRGHGGCMLAIHQGPSSGLNNLTWQLVEGPLQHHNMYT
jgi:hypothetical protein